MASTNKAPKIDINKLPPYFLQMFPQAKQILTTDPMPGREAEHAAAIKVIQDFLNTDFQKPIDLENVCGHKAPGVVMKEGYCPACYKKENIDECLQYMELCEGPFQLPMKRPGKLFVTMKEIRKLTDQYEYQGRKYQNLPAPGPRKYMLEEFKEFSRKQIEFFIDIHYSFKNAKKRFMGFEDF